MVLGPSTIYGYACLMYSNNYITSENSPKPSRCQVMVYRPIVAHNHNMNTVYIMTYFRRSITVIALDFCVLINPQSIFQTKTSMNTLRV